VDLEVQLHLTAVDAGQDRGEAGLLRFVQRDGAGDLREGAPATVRGEPRELLDTTGRLELAATSDRARREDDRERVHAALEQPAQQHRPTSGFVPSPVEGRGEVPAAVDQAGGLEELPLDLLQHSLAQGEVEEGRDPEQLEGVEDVLLLGPASPHDLERELEGAGPNPAF